MSEVDREYAGKTVDVSLPKDIGDANAFPPLEDQGILPKRLHLREIDHHPRCIGDDLFDHNPSPLRRRLREVTPPPLSVDSPLHRTGLTDLAPPRASPAHTPPSAPR